MNNQLRSVLTMMLIVLTAAAVFAGGFVAGHFTALPGSPLPALADSDALVSLTGSGPSDDLKALFAPFWEAWDVVHEEYVDQPVDDVALMQGAIRGMMEALGDPHSSYLSPDEYSIFNADQSGALEGIGAYVEAGEEGGLRIVSPFPGSPAEEAGLLPGDLIIAVDGTDVMGMEEYAIINMVRGRAGTTVHLTVRRDGHDDVLEFNVTRRRIIIPSVEFEMLDGRVAYVKLNNFGEPTARELREALNDLMRQDPTGLVLDLRGNPGGFLNTAIEVASQFLPGGTLVMQEAFGDGRVVNYEAFRGGQATTVPLVVLVNEGSASASEIVAGAIQDAGRGTLVGETTYGKGSVQHWRDLRGDNGGIRVTIARWLTPDGRSIHEAGIVPDVIVELTEEDLAAGRDPQLDAALELLAGN